MLQCFTYNDFYTVRNVVMCGVMHVGNLKRIIASQASSTSLDFKHTDTNKQSLGMMHGCYTPCLLQEEYTRMEMHPQGHVQGRGFDSEEETGKVPGRQQVARHEKASIIHYAENLLEKASITHHAENLQTSDGHTHVSVNLVALLKACAKQKDLRQGSKLHDDIARDGLLANNVFIGSAVVSMYAKCGALEKAQDVFDKLPVRNVVLWTALITGYVQQGYGKKALKCFGQMQLEGFSPNAITFSCILKACGQIGDLEKGEEVHAHIMKEHLLRKDVIVASALVDMYAKCGALDKAQGVLDEMPFRNEVSWNALITGYAQYERGEEALACFQRMQFEGLSPNPVTLASILKACGSVGALETGQEIHAQIVRECLLEKDLVIGTALVDMYAKCGAVEKAQEVFDRIPVQDIVIWNALIAGYDQHRRGEEALSCFERMQLGGCSPDSTTFMCVLNACGSIGDLDKGQEIHAQIVREHLLEEQIEVANALVDMYVKCGALGKAQEVFYELPVRDVISWNALIAGFAQHGHGKEAVECYEQMRLNGFSPNAITFACILKACGSIGASDKGQEIHAQIAMECLLEKDVMVGTALVDMYAKCGAFGKAHKVFEELPSWNVVTWNALIAGYAQHEHGEEAFDCFEQMQRERFSPDAVTFTCILKACGSIGAAYMGQILHAEIVRHGLPEMGSVVAIALLVMYASCGMLAEAHYLFDKLPVKDVVSWGALLGGYAQLGKDEVVLDLFDRMIGEGIEPNTVIFAVILNVCSHRGLLDEGQMYFEIISKDYGIIATLEHHTSLIDLFCRAGHLDEAVALAEKISCTADLTMWHTLLSACRKWGNMKLGRWAFEHAVQLGEKDAAVYISMSNIYAAADRLEDARKIEAVRRKEELAWRNPEHSWWTNTSGIIHLFSIGDHTHPRSEDIYAKLVSISDKLSQECFSLTWVFQGICNDAEKNVLCDHSEKLAIACALINVSKVTNIRIVKNMRMCGNCHHATSLVSRIEKCSISVKDANRLHIFEDGKCMCLDHQF